MRGHIYDMTSEEVGLFANIIHRLSDAHWDSDIRQTILPDVLQLLRADIMASFVWDNRTNSFLKPIVINQDPENVKRYETWYQYRDPMSFQLRALRRPAHVEEVISRRDLVRTPFFNDFLAKDGMSHGINLFLLHDNRDLADLRIWRVRGRPDFSEREIDLLAVLGPFLKRALARAPDVSLECLTAREREVAFLIGKGCADKDIARVLDIGFTTVRTHVGNCLAKLGCSNRSELAAFVVRMSH